MSDFHPCRSVLLTVGQQLLSLAVPHRCDRVASDTYITISRAGVAFAKYAMHGTDRYGVVFYIDADLTGREGNYTYVVESCGQVVDKGNLIVQNTRLPLQPTDPSTQCHCEGC